MITTKEIQFIEVAKEKKLVMPLPFSSFTHYDACNPHLRSFISLEHSFELFNERIRGWVNGSIYKVDAEWKIEYIQKAFRAIGKSGCSIEKLLLEHVDKVEIITDFSGVDLGIEIWEKRDKFEFRFGNDLYKNLDFNEFLKLSDEERFFYYLDNCLFIPFRFLEDSIDFMDDTSHKFKVIKRDDYLIKSLENYLKGLTHQPSDNVYYFIRYNAQQPYLVRDLAKSPKQNKKN